MNKRLLEQAKRLRNLSNYIKIRVESLDDLSSNNVIAELKEIAEVIEKEVNKSEASETTDASSCTDLLPPS